MKRDEKEVSKILIKIFNENFYGKEKGRYRITHDQIEELAGRKSIDKTFINGISKYLFGHGFIFIDITKQYIILEKDLLHRYRKVTPKIMEKFTPQKTMSKRAKKTLKRLVKKR